MACGYPYPEAGVTTELARAGCPTAFPATCRGATLVEALVSLALLSSTVAALAPTLWQLRESGEQVHATLRTLMQLQSASESLRLDGVWRAPATPGATDTEPIVLIEESSFTPRLRSLRLQTSEDQIWPLLIYQDHELGVDVSTRREPAQRPWP